MNEKIIVVRMRGEIGTRREMIDTFKMLGMKKLHSFVVLEKSPSIIGMVRKIDNFSAWGEPTPETLKLIEGISKRQGAWMVGGLKSPKGGIKSKKLRYPRGNLGYCGAAINEMIKKMV